MRLEPGTTKNANGWTLPYELLPDLCTVIDVRWREHERLTQAGVICPFVFHGAGVPIADFRETWVAAREAPVCRESCSMTSGVRPCGISCAGCAGEDRDVDHRTQDAQRLRWVPEVGIVPEDRGAERRRSRA